MFLGLLKKHDAPPRAAVLEFASGYGCVTRHLVNAPNIELWCSDIHEDAIDFLRRELGARPILSAHVPEDFKPAAAFDAVFALSFFTHMPLATWERWLARLIAVTRPGGLIIFTTHGLQSVQYVCPGTALPESGFWFTAASEQKDLPTEEYGLSVTTPDFVRAAIERTGAAELLAWCDGIW
jgi:cyclopropane fatty-acyl-phospholipid synthase-like methyltransferase